MQSALILSMHKPIRHIVCVGLFLLGMALAGCGDVPPLRPLADADVIVAFGDSLTFGTGASPAESYPAVLAQLLGRKVIGAGVPGETTAQGLARLPKVVAEHQPRLMIVCLGGNDMLQKIDVRQTKENLRAIINALKAEQIDVVLIGVPKPALITSAPEFFEELAAELGLPYEGEIVTDVLYHNDQKSDPIHPNAKGYRRIAEAIAALLKKAGAV